MIAVLILTGCTSCGGSADQRTESSDTDETWSETKQVVITLTGEVNYKIIRPEGADDETIACASALWKSIYNMTGKPMIGLSEDFVKTEGEADNENPEILLGLTNRPETEESAKALPSYLDYSITVIGNKIVIYANKAARLREAVEFFLEKLTYSDGVLTYINDDLYIDSYSQYEYINVTLCGTDISEYSIIISENCGKAEKDFAEKLALWFAEICGIKPGILDDSSTQNKNEILIGKTNRTQSNDFINGNAALGKSYYAIRTSGGCVMLAAGSAAGYNLIMGEFAELMNEGNGSLALGIDKQIQNSSVSLDGSRVMFVGNSFTYYGECVSKSTTNQVDKGYFYQIAKNFGDNLTVINFTYGGASLWHNASGGLADPCLYTEMKSLHPNYYNNPDGKALDSFYDQDYVILQQSGDNISSTYADAKAIMALFPPETKFCFYVTTHDLSSNHTYTIKAAEKLRDEGVIYIPLGHMVYNIWTGNEKIAGTSLIYNKNSFIVKKTSSDGYHPNYLTGYLTALMTYCAITKNTANGADCKFVNTEKTFYTYENATSNFDQILTSEPDMKALQALINKYIEYYNS